jgi:glycosyltransferase involved in cell wall biosynthesis
MPHMSLIEQQSTHDPSSGPRGGEPQVSVVIPCLNEAGTVAECVDRARHVLDSNELEGEIIVVDNGSEDGSGSLAAAAGANVVWEPERGYGSAYLAGLATARGRYVVMADADLTYDLAEIPRFVAELESGADMVIGNRMKNIQPGAMPWHHRYIGNPLLSGFLNLLFRTGVDDAHCGMRALRRDTLPRLDLRTTGMEFASEMVIRAAKEKLVVRQFPIEYHPRAGESKLSSVRDGWRHLRFLLLFCPRWLFLIPGFALMLCGSTMTLWLLGGTRMVGSIGLDIHTMLVSGVFALIGYELVLFGAFIKIFAMRAGFLPVDRRTASFFRVATLEKGLLVGAALTLTGLTLVLLAVVSWGHNGYGALDTDASMRPLIVAVLLIAGGVQTIFASFVMSVLGLQDKVVQPAGEVLEPDLDMLDITALGRRHDVA